MLRKETRPVRRQGKSHKGLKSSLAVTASNGFNQQNIEATIERREMVVGGVVNQNSTLGPPVAFEQHIKSGRSDDGGLYVCV